jgi:hypothetical protein
VGKFLIKGKYLADFNAFVEAETETDATLKVLNAKFETGTDGSLRLPECDDVDLFFNPKALNPRVQEVIPIDRTDGKNKGN